MQAVRKAAQEPKQRVLVVDDNRDNRNMLTLLLNDMGFVVQTAATGTEAMELCRSFRPDCALVDIVLPDIDGCQLSFDLRGLPGMDGAKIVAVTAYDDDRARARAVEAGCNGYFLKPLSPMVLAHLLSSEYDPRPAPGSRAPDRATIIEQPQFLDDEERAEVTAIVVQLDMGHPVRHAFEAGVDTRRLARIANTSLRQRLQDAFMAAVGRFSRKG